MAENTLAAKHIERAEVTLSELLAVQDLQPLGGFVTGREDSGANED